MKHLKLTFLFFALLASNLFYAQKDTLKKKDELVWYTDLMQANEVSKTTKKPIFAFFTGSDWCVWCWKLQSDVFSKPEFIDWAKKNVVLLELDFPKRKSLSPELAQQNNSLQQTFQVQGYPTIWLFFMNKNKDSDPFTLESLGSLGYPQGSEVGKEQVKFLKDANALLKKKPSK
ncbi:thioredoxin family protein [Aurantibacillus circumpalustris]|uniref:thioredoxin family protein n=1 Tax=Aurantibacillus circumpalustris TaxID=3036359 RepID=UPI00295BEE1E|nr:thioredoxin family protein [Aurantibacillus circumpalustris]